MKKVYVLCKNHLDLIWLRCFEDHYDYQGSVVRPYVDIEEALFDRWISYIDRSECKYSIEQSLSVKKYLERNPDKFDKFKKLVGEGRIELFGGGEAVIDYNMVTGESMVRSHLYSIIWYLEQFDRRPYVGIAPDTFGLSAQLPQVYRDLGYNSISIYSRIFRDARPFWQGLDGSTIFIQQDYTDQGFETFRLGAYDKYEECPDCAGEGCRTCDYTGNDYSLVRDKKVIKDCFKKIKESSLEDFFMVFTGEEMLEEDNFLNILENYSKEYDVEYEFINYEEKLKRFAGEYLERLEAGEVKQEEIDSRIEGNPIGTGCYVSRIELKKLNRELEDLLLSAEKFAALAADTGMIYPGKKIARLWSLMALLQFHDSITSTHVDAAYDELLVIIRNIKLGAYQIYQEAMQTIEKSIDIQEKSGYEPVVIFNPLNWEVENNIYEIVITSGKSSKNLKPVIVEAEGRKLNIVDYRIIENKKNIKMRVKFKNTTLPSVGYRVLYYKLVETEENLTDRKKHNSVNSEQNRTSTQSMQIVENEYYQIKIDDNGLAGIYDKELAEDILSTGTGNLVLQEDYGSPWETLATPYSQIDLNNCPGIVVNVEKYDQKQVIAIKGEYSNIDRKLDDKVGYIKVKQEIILYQGIKKIYFKSDIDWDTANMRIMTKFPLTFTTENDEAFYEVPYGILKRPGYQGEFGKHMNPNGDWPALNFISCYNQDKDYSVNLFNKGLPANRVEDGNMYLSLLRSPDIPIWLFDYDGSKDRGHHSFEYMISSNKGDIKQGSVVQQGLEYNTTFMNCEGHSKAGELSDMYSFLSNENKNVIVSAIKRAESNDDLVIRSYETYGEEVEDNFEMSIDGKILESDLLETREEEVPKLVYKPYKIKTLKVK